MRLKIAVRGAVQGVGFRPYVNRLAADLGLAGWVNNSSQGVFIEVEGPPADLEHFLKRLPLEKPLRSFIQTMETWWLDPVGYDRFEIRVSDDHGGKTAIIMPDLATCPECLAEILDAKNRRHLYPFTNCTNCGPRFSIVEALPYDRANTSMKLFAMCAECEHEYRDPRDRRFHAEPIACPKCGPHLELWDAAGVVKSTHHAALLAAAEAIYNGQILALKGIGGFQLLADARNEDTVRTLRERKHREEKPFAVLYPSLAAARVDCRISDAEAQLLSSPESPIVLLHRTGKLAPSVAPGNPNLGVMLPYSPLHHLLMRELQMPVVASSGNLSDEPICIEEREALERLGDIADLFLVHDRPIVRHLDDSVARVLLGRQQILRRARGYAPLPVRLAENLPADVPEDSAPVLAVGAHLKNTVALAIGPQVFISQHIGDLETVQAHEAFVRVIEDFQRLYEAQPAVIACDGHREYLSTKFARRIAEEKRGVELLPVQHHIAHVLACMAENELKPPVLGVSWDGTGAGLDGTIWGGEFFVVTDVDCRRVAHLRQFRLPGGEQAVREPRRSALGMLFELLGENRLAPAAERLSFSAPELRPLLAMLKGGINSPLTSSVGRLFDAVAALLQIRGPVSFEGQAAMALEFAANDLYTTQAYSIPVQPAAADASMLLLDWGPAMMELMSDLAAKVETRLVSARFHNGLAESIVAVARQFNHPQVALSGGCFQNRYLTERTVVCLEEAGFRPYWHQRIPPNDGGISLGQVVAAYRNVLARFAGAP